MTSKLKYKCRGNNVEVITDDIKEDIVSKEVWDGMTSEEKLVVKMIQSHPDSFKTTVQIGDKDVTVYATPGCSINYPGKAETTEIHTLPVNCIQRAGAVFPETHPVLYLAFASVTIENIIKRNMFAWVDVNVVNSRNATIINRPVLLGPETYGVDPLGKLKFHSLNEVHIVDSTLNKVDDVVGTDINNSYISGKGIIHDSIIDDMNCEAKELRLDHAFVSSAGIRVKSLDVRPVGCTSVSMIDFSFRVPKAELLLEHPIDIFKIDLGLVKVVYARRLGSTQVEPVFCTHLEDVLPDDKPEYVDPTDTKKHLAFIKAVLIHHHELTWGKGNPIDEDELENLLDSLKLSIESRARILKLLGLQITELPKAA